MAKPRLVDTGVNINDSSINETILANNGAEMILDAEIVSFTTQAIVDSQATTKYRNNVQTNEYVSLNPLHNGIQSPKVSVKMYLDKSKYAELRALFMMAKTKGRKRLYCDLAQVMYDSTQTDPYFEGFVSNLKVDDAEPNSKNYYFITFDFEVLE